MILSQYSRRLFTDVLFFISFYPGLQFCPSLSTISGVWYLSRYLRSSLLFAVRVKLSVCYLMSADSIVYKHVDNFAKPINSSKQNSF
jgi:hypothetical protein